MTSIQAIPTTNTLTIRFIYVNWGKKKTKCVGDSDKLSANPVQKENFNTAFQSLNDKVSEAVQMSVLSYLSFYRFGATAHAFTKAISSSLGVMGEDKVFIGDRQKLWLESIPSRRELMQMVEDGNIEGAIEQYQLIFPDLFCHSEPARDKMMDHQMESNINSSNDNSIDSNSNKNNENNLNNSNDNTRSYSLTSLNTFYPANNSSQSSITAADSAKTSAYRLAKDSLFELNEGISGQCISASMLHYRLLTQQFIELVRVGDSARALEYTESVLAPIAVDFGGERLANLEEVMVLLAYADPAQSPVRHLLDLKRRLVLAEQLNAVILQRSESILDSWLKQLLTVSQSLKDSGEGVDLIKSEAFTMINSIAD